jgi:hypothetical protein
MVEFPFGCPAIRLCGTYRRLSKNPISVADRC